MPEVAMLIKHLDLLYTKMLMERVSEQKYLGTEYEEKHISENEFIKFGMSELELIDEGFKFDREEYTEEGVIFVYKKVKSSFEDLTYKDAEQEAKNKAYEAYVFTRTEEFKEWDSHWYLGSVGSNLLDPNGELPLEHVMEDLKLKRKPRSKEFKEWFGHDWENNMAFKLTYRLLDPNGELPLTTIMEHPKLKFDSGPGFHPFRMSQKVSYPELLPADKKLNSKIENFLREIGVPIKTVKTLRDREGSPMGGIAVADMLRKVVEVVENKADITTLPEEAAHFFVEIIKETNPKLYNQMFNNITDYSIYQYVIDNYGKLEGYEGNQHKLRDEAIGKLIANEIVDRHIQDENVAKLPAFKRWFAKLIRAIKNAIGKIFSNPYRAAAYEMLNKEVSQYKDVVAGITSNSTYLQTEGGTEAQANVQDNVVNKIIKGHHSIELNPDMLKSWIEEHLPADYKLLRVLMEQDEDGVFARYVIDQGPNKAPIMITNRTTDEGTRQFIAKVGKLRAQEINKSVKAQHAREHGTIFI